MVNIVLGIVLKKSKIKLARHSFYVVYLSVK